MWMWFRSGICTFLHVTLLSCCFTDLFVILGKWHRNAFITQPRRLTLNKQHTFSFSIPGGVPIYFTLATWAAPTKKEVLFYNANPGCTMFFILNFNKKYSIIHKKWTEIEKFPTVYVAVEERLLSKFVFQINPLGGELASPPRHTYIT